MCVGNTWTLAARKAGVAATAGWTALAGVVLPAVADAGANAPAASPAVNAATTTTMVRPRYLRICPPSPDPEAVERTLADADDEGLSLGRRGSDRSVNGVVPLVAHSHSMVPGGLLVTSTTTRLTSGTSLVIRVEMRASTS